jgi:glycosyltransferase involved in cell wall biosynthesis
VSGRRHRILLINQYAGSPTHGMEFRPYLLAREWVRSGHEVLIVAGSPSHVRARNPELRRIVTRERIEEVDFEWLRLPSYDGNGTRRAANIIAFASLVRGRSASLARAFRPDIVVASSTHPLDIYGARAIARRSNARLVFEVHDLWPLTPIELGGVSPRNPFMLAMGRAETYACAHADTVVSIPPETDRYLLTRGMDAARYVHIPNGVALEESDSQRQSLPTEHESLLAQLRAAGTFIVGYAGGLGMANAMDDLLAAAALVREENIAIVLWGDGPDRGALELQARTGRLANVHLLGRIAKAAVRTALEACDAVYLGWKDLSIYRFGVSPNKLYDYMAAGRPILHATNAPSDPVAASGSGLSVAAEDVPAIASALVELTRLTHEERRAMGARGRQHVVANHEYGRLAERFLDAVGADRASVRTQSR